MGGCARCRGAIAGLVHVREIAALQLFPLFRKAITVTSARRTADRAPPRTRPVERSAAAQTGEQGAADQNEHQPDKRGHPSEQAVSAAPLPCTAKIDWSLPRLVPPAKVAKVTRKRRWRRLRTDGQPDRAHHLVLYVALGALAIGGSSFCCWTPRFQLAFLSPHCCCWAWWSPRGLLAPARRAHKWRSAESKVAPLYRGPFVKTLAPPPS